MNKILSNSPLYLNLKILILNYLIGSKKNLSTLFHSGWMSNPPSNSKEIVIHECNNKTGFTAKLANKHIVFNCLYSILYTHFFTNICNKT